VTFPRPLGLGANRPVDGGAGVTVDTFVLVPMVSLPAVGVEGQQVLLANGTHWQYISGAWTAVAGSGLDIPTADARYRKKQSYVHTQGVASASWTIVHNLGTYPAVVVEDSSGAVVEVGWTYVDDTTLIITAVGAFSGRAYLS
jgi:hypothetical protein